MGREIEKICIDRGHSIVSRVDVNADDADSRDLTHSICKDSDVIIEFSLAKAVLDHIKTYAENKTPAVVGTTGWLEKLEDARNIINKNQGTFLYGSNFSIGAHMFFNLLARAGDLAEKVEAYDVMLHEIHHKKKQDSPSGTAVSAAEIVKSRLERKSIIQTETLHRQIKEEEMQVSSLRGGYVPGTHTLYMDSEADTIEITHRARNRKGFALGAVLAAEWVVDKTGFFTVEEFIEDFLKN